MINNIKQSLALKLLELYPDITIYDEDIPQNFKTPSFLITVIDQDYSKRISNKNNSILNIDIAYFSNKDKTQIKNDCLEVQQNLFRNLDLVNGFRCIDKQTTITDNVLHLTFNIKYSEMMIIDEIKMEEFEANTNIKE